MTPGRGPPPGPEGTGRRPAGNGTGPWSAENAPGATGIDLEETP